MNTNEIEFTDEQLKDIEELGNMDLPDTSGFNTLLGLSTFIIVVFLIFRFFPFN